MFNNATPILSAVTLANNGQKDYHAGLLYVVAKAMADGIYAYYTADDGKVRVVRGSAQATLDMLAEQANVTDFLTESSLSKIGTNVRETGANLVGTFAQESDRWAACQAWVDQYKSPTVHKSEKEPKQDSLTKIAADSARRLEALGLSTADLIEFFLSMEEEDSAE